jgi:hypothetical protein
MVRGDRQSAEKSVDLFGFQLISLTSPVESFLDANIPPKTLPSRATMISMIRSPTANLRRRPQMVFLLPGDASVALLAPGELEFVQLLEKTLRHLQWAMEHRT